MKEVRAKIGTNQTILDEMVLWCSTNCPNSYYFFMERLCLDEPAIFWFDDELDAFAFRIKFGL